MLRKLLLILTIFALHTACKNPDNGEEVDTTSTEYTVTFNSNHADVTGYKLANPESITVSANSTVGSLPTAPTRVHHDFVKWTMNPDGSGGNFTTATTVNANITVYAQWTPKGITPPDTYTINIHLTGNVSGDSASVSPNLGEAGDTITINYTLANDKTNNKLVFSGTTAAIAQVNAAGTGTRTYIVNGSDANGSGVITINAAFSHTNSTPVNPGEYRNLFVEMLGKSQQEVNTKVQNAFNRLFVNGAADQIIYYEVAPDMAYILDVNNNDVRSEGMSYGMMMCVQMDDKDRFDRLWKWAYTYMYNDRTVKIDNVRGYFSWQCNTNGTRKDPGIASDGEAYFITALLFASNRWGDGSGIYEYGRKAREILFDMINRTNGVLDNYSASTMFNLQHKLPLFTTNGAGVGGQAGHTDPSYVLPAFYEIWAIEIEEGTQYHDIFNGLIGSTTVGEIHGAAANAQFWRDAATAGRAFFQATTNATTGLGPDYANFDGTPRSGQHADFRHDAWRIAMNIGMDYSWWGKDPWQVTFANRIQSFFNSKGVSSYGQLWTLGGNLLNEANAGDHSGGLAACNAVASLAATETTISTAFVQNLWDVPMLGGQYRYYDGCLYMLGLLHVSGNFKIYSR